MTHDIKLTSTECPAAKSAHSNVPPVIVARELAPALHCPFATVKCDLDRATQRQYAAEETDAAAPSASGDGFVDKLQQCHLPRYGHDLPALVFAAGMHLLQPS